MRPFAIVVAAALVFVMGAVQVASYAAYGDLATRPSLPAALHAAAPALFRAAIGGPRARAAAAVHDGDVDAAGRLVATLPDDAVSADLRGRIDTAMNRPADAVTEFVRAGDGVRAQLLIDRLAETDLVRAAADESALVSALTNDAAASEVTGQAWWRLGQLQAEQGYRDRAHRATLWNDAERAYEHALTFAPNEETYLLAAGYQSLVNSDVAASTRFYTRAVEIVPNSADGYAGLAWATAVAGDCAIARANLTRSRALRTGRVRDPIDDPNVGGARLRACVR